MTTVLILVVVEDSLGAGRRKAGEFSAWVLILVVVEDSLGGYEKDAVWLAWCLVLILVVVEDSLGVWYVATADSNEDVS